MLKLTALALFAAFLGAEAAAAQTMTLTSPDIAPGAKIADEQVANVFGCKGGNISPALSWSGAPKDTKSFALSVYDPDAPTGSGFWHWVVFNIPPDVTSLPKDAGNLKGAEAPKGAVQSRTDLGVPGYGGPCPRRATRRTTITSRFSPWTRRSSTGMKTRAPPWSASCCISTRSPKGSWSACTGSDRPPARGSSVDAVSTSKWLARGALFPPRPRRRP